MSITSVLKKFFHNHIDGPLAGYLRDSDGAIKPDVVVSEIVDVTIENLPAAVDTPTVYNVTLALADTEYEQVLPNNTKEILIKSRALAGVLYDIRWAWETGRVAIPTVPYMTLEAGLNYGSDGNDLDGQSIFLASAQAGVVVEVEVWT